MSDVLVFAASLRRESTNKLLAKVLDSQLKELGFQSTYIDLKEYPLPVYDDDLYKEDLPDSIETFLDFLEKAKAIVISTPEYNNHISPVLKNWIDWMSRPYRGQKSLHFFKNKIVLLASASPSHAGGIRGLDQAQIALSKVNTIVLPPKFSLPKSHEAFDNGQLKDDKYRQRIEMMCKELKKWL